MSFDISIEVPACSKCERGIETVWDINVTHNTNEIVERCMLAALDPPIGLRVGACYRERAWGRLAGWQCREVLPFLERTLAAMNAQERQAELREHEPDNGWGSVQSARTALEKLIEACKETPTGKIDARG